MPCPKELAQGQGRDSFIRSKVTKNPNPVFKKYENDNTVHYFALMTLLVALYYTPPDLYVM